MDNQIALDVLYLLKEMKRDIKCECYTSIIRCEYGLALEWKAYPYGSPKSSISVNYSVALNQDELKESKVNMVEKAIKQATEYMNNA